MKIALLDHGFVRFVEAWGTGDSGTAESIETGDLNPAQMDYERGIVEAARQSTQGAFRGWDEDKKLLTHLYNNHHSTPFEFAGMVIEVMAPIAVFREWHRHRTQSYNEMSARYAPLPNLVYHPTIERALMVNDAGRNKQAGGIDKTLLTEEAAIEGLAAMQSHAEYSRLTYDRLLTAGFAKEIARGVLPVFQYSQMRASTNLRNWLAFMTLRCDPLAQWEIRQYAWAVSDIVKEKFPKTWELWMAGVSK